MNLQIKINKGSYKEYRNMFLTSDLHFNHANIIKYCNRPYKDVYHMNSSLIAKWNGLVTEDDIVFVHGDFVPFEKDINVIIDFVDELNGTKVLIKGNHDELPADKYLLAGFEECHEQCLVSVKGDKEIDHQRIMMNHYPMLTWNYSHRGSWHTYGHIHSLAHQPFIGSPNQYDVGVDRNNLNPVSWNQLKTIITQQALYGKEDN